MYEGETPTADEILEGETPIAVEICEGETPVVFEVREGETPVSVEIAEGETPVFEKAVEGETPIPGDVRGENPIYIEGATPMVVEEGVTPEKLLAESDLHSTAEPEPEEGLKLIMDLVDD